MPSFATFVDCDRGLGFDKQLFGSSAPPLWGSLPLANPIALALNGLVSSQSSLRISTYVGLLAAVLAMLMALLVLYWRLLFPIRL